MKTKLRIWVGLMILTSGASIAATLQINIPTADLARLAEAYGKVYNLGHDATVTDMQDIIRFQMISTVYGYEARKATAAISPTPLAMQPTPTATFTPTPTPTP